MASTNMTTCGKLLPFLFFISQTLFFPLCLPGFDFVSKDSRDGVFLGNCDDGVEQLVRLLGWEEEFRSMVNKGPVNKL